MTVYFRGLVSIYQIVTFLYTADCGVMSAFALLLVFFFVLVYTCF